VTAARLNIGRWAGPGVLLLIAGEGRYLDPATLPRAEVRRLREQARAVVGVDGPRISITRVPVPGDTVAP
jgi:hypothetical protein